ncbi:MAG: threonine--tRNA ligase [Acidobacteria bacterium]|nr:threonine--tRNA ligase [Acidobacteriota bacterium]MBV9436128.1 threonine--tRNA ligase [Acidobacteriota bacterium]
MPDVAQASETMKITLPDGSARDVPRGTTAYEIAKSISPRLADAALAAKLNGKVVDLGRPIEENAELRILTDKDPESLEVFRHSTAHVMATAVTELFPETKLGHGPPTESGFFYDFYRPTPFTPEDLQKIEQRMQEVVERDEKFVRECVPRDEALRRYEAEGDWMKVHFIQKHTEGDGKVSFYRNGRFVDFCRGPHVPNTGKIKAFKLLGIAGAYWLGDEKNQQLQRISGTSFFSKKDLEQYLNAIEEAKKRDHRVLGQQLDLFSIQELAGPGLIFWHPKGGIIRKEMEDWMRAEYLRRGYSLVFTPHVMRTDLWKTSGHSGYYAQNMFTPMELDDAEYQLKPMNCPGHILIYQNTLRSYRDLPVRLGEFGSVYRYERSGVMHGLLRVRGFTQDDAHIFCTPEQIEDEIVGCIDFALAVLKTYGFDKYEVELSIWDPNDPGKYIGSKENWEQAIRSLEKAMQRRDIPYKTIPGEAAFYGPKIDVKLVDAIGRLWQLSTVQFDFTLPERFKLEYVAEDGTRKQPLMVHRALYGSIERFFGVLIEHYAGNFPVWLSPVQVVMIPISERHAGYAEQVAEELKAAGVRVHVDARNEKMNAKIREHTLQKVPFLLVVGDKEAEAGEVSVRVRGKGDEGKTTTVAFVARIRHLIETRSSNLE